MLDRDLWDIPIMYTQLRMNTWWINGEKFRYFGFIKTVVKFFECTAKRVSQCEKSKNKNRICVT